MAHKIDQSTGRDAIAFVGQTPWHGLGQKLEEGCTIHEWTVAAGLNWNVERTNVLFKDADCSLHVVPNRDVLYRSDTKKALGVVGKDYKVVQPEEVMAFFGELVSIGGFTLETAGVLSDGKRIWALAKIHNGAPIIGHDVVKPYLLLSTSYDATMSTIARLIGVRVVCDNTLSIALAGAESVAQNRPVLSTVRVPHNLKFDAEQVRRDLGIFANSFDKWVIQTKLLAHDEINLDTAAKMAKELIEPTLRAKEGQAVDVKASKGYQRILDLFDGQGKGSDIAGPTKWGFVNAVTEYIDHERGNDASRLNSAWFGNGELLKNRAYQIALAD